MLAGLLLIPAEWTEENINNDLIAFFSKVAKMALIKIHRVEAGCVAGSNSGPFRASAAVKDAILGIGKLCVLEIIVPSLVFPECYGLSASLVGGVFN
jgi:hypothetical protein